MTLLPKELRPTLVSCDLGSYLPESPIALETWVGWGQAGAGPTPGGRFVHPRFLEPLQSPFQV